MLPEESCGIASSQDLAYLVCFRVGSAERYLLWRDGGKMPAYFATLPDSSIVSSSAIHALEALARQHGWLLSDQEPHVVDLDETNKVLAELRPGRELSTPDAQLLLNAWNAFEELAPRRRLVGYLGDEASEWTPEMMNAGTRIKPLLDQLGKHIEDHALLGRVQADLTDILEVCEWFELVVDSSGQRGLDREEAESLLIDIEINLLDHLAYHLKSMKRDMPALLKMIERPDSREADDRP